MAIDDLTRWKTVKALTVYEAALLASGYVPTDHLDHAQWPSEVVRRAAPIVRSLQDAVGENEIGLDIHRSTIPRRYIDVNWEDTKLKVSSIRGWMVSNGIFSDFFNPAPNLTVDDYLNTQSPHFAFKLAAAVRAWEYVSAHPETRFNKRPKTAIKNWLEDNAEELGLLKRDGELNRSAIEEIATVANWDQSGGAPATNDVTT